MKHKPVKQKVPVKKGKTEKSNGYDEKKYLLGRERQSETLACRIGRAQRALRQKSVRFSTFLFQYLSKKRHKQA